VDEGNHCCLRIGPIGRPASNRQSVGFWVMHGILERALCLNLKQMGFDEFGPATQGRCRAACTEWACIERARQESEHSTVVSTQKL
jgi:hypothetical protein